MTKAIVVPWAGDGPLKALPRLVDVNQDFESVAKGLWCECFDPKSKRYIFGSMLEFAKIDDDRGDYMVTDGDEYLFFTLIEV